MMSKAGANFQGVMNAVAGQAGAPLRPPGPPKWHDDICSCMDDTNVCCQSVFCECCSVSNVVNMLEERKPEIEWATCLVYTLSWYLTRGFSTSWFAFGARRELMEKYGIQGESACATCMFASFCGPCTVCQVQREMAARGDHPGGICAEPPKEQQQMGAVGQAVGGAMQALGQVANVTGAGIPGVARPWGSGLCDFEMTECLEGFFCLCCVFGYMSTVLDAKRNVPGVRLPDRPEGQLEVAACLGSMFQSIGFAYGTRREIMQRYNVGPGESHLMSALLAVFCTCCIALQQRREMGFSGEWPGGMCVKEAPQRPEQRGAMH